MIHGLPTTANVEIMSLRATANVKKTSPEGGGVVGQR